MKLNLNDFDFEDFEELPQKQKIVKKKNKDVVEDKEKNDTYKKQRKRKDDLDVLFR